MKIIKLIAVILLAVYLFFSSAFDLFQYQIAGGVAFLLGLCAAGAGILILLSARLWLHHSDNK